MNPPVPTAAGPARLATFMLATALAATLPGCGGRDEAPAEPTASLTVAVASPATQPLDRTIVVSGSVAAWQEMSLGVELNGLRVAAVLVEVGDVVKRGQPLVRLDARTLDVQARQADAAVAQAEANLALAEAESERGRTLLEQKLISRSDADQLTANLLRARAQRLTAEADRDAVRLSLGFATLVAPEAGVIAARTVQPGQVVSGGAELLRLIRDRRLEWRAELPELDLIRVREGAAVVVRGPGGVEVRGRVRTVSPGLDPQSRTGLVYADLPEPGSLRAGMFAEGQIVLGRDQATVLPREAIVYRDGLAYVFVVKAPEGGGDTAVARVEQRRITVGTPQGAVVEVTGGVAARDRIVARGAGFLSDGDLVRIAPVATASTGGSDDAAAVPEARP